MFFQASSPELPSTSLPRDLSVWQRFAQANKRICTSFFQPRLYTMSHMSTVDWWLGHHAAALAKRSRLLEFGCGTTFPLSRQIGRFFQSCDATDLEDVARERWPANVTFRVCTANALPYADNTFDAIVIRSVLEHVENPRRVMQELSRVLAPDGFILMNLPNKWDYVSIASRVLGSSKSSVLHAFVPGAWDDFPVYYRCNTRRGLEQSIAGTQLGLVHFRPLPSEPGCLNFFVPLYLLGAVYQFVISILALDVLQPAFLVILKKGSGTLETREEA